jgi:glycosyltransferase involved in cell wall biosynthesis
MARFDRQKGLDRLLALVRESARRGAPLEWRVVGKNVLAENGRPAPDLSALKPYLHPPAVDAATLTRHYGWADVLVLVSRYEGSPLTILEAQQVGCVPVSTDTGAVCEMIDNGRTGYLLENTEDTPALTAVALDLLGRLQQDRNGLLGVARQAVAARRAQTWRRSVQEFAACLDGWCPPKEKQ